MRESTGEVCLLMRVGDNLTDEKIEVVAMKGRREKC